MQHASVASYYRCHKRDRAPWLSMVSGSITCMNLKHLQPCCCLSSGGATAARRRSVILVLPTKEGRPNHHSHPLSLLTCTSSCHSCKVLPRPCTIGLGTSALLMVTLIGAAPSSCCVMWAV